MKVLVTGGAGFIGSHLAGALVEAGHRVIVFDNLHPQTHPTRTRPAALPSEVELVVADVRDRETLWRSVQRVDAIYHLAALTGVGQSMYQVAEYSDVNIGGTAVLLDILANERHHVRRMILASSRAVYGEGAYHCATCGPVIVRNRDGALLEKGIWDPLCPHCAAPLRPYPTPESLRLMPCSVYAASKVAKEHLVQCVGAAYALEVVILRYFNVYGPRQSLANPYTGILSIFFSQLRAGQRIEVYEDGQESRDFVYVADVVQANLLALERPAASGQTFNIGTGQSTSVLEVARSIAERLGCPENTYTSGRFRAGDVRHCYADINKARKLLGYSPAIALPDGLTSLLAWASEQEWFDQTTQAERELLGRGLLRGTARQDKVV